MGKKPTSEKRLEKLLKHMREHGQDMAVDRRQSPPQEKALSPPEHKMLLRKLTPSVTKAFEKAGLDIDNQTHWGQLLLYFCWAYFGKRGPGAPKKWSRKRLRQLVSDVHEMREGDPTLSESRCCNLLGKGKAGNGKYEGMNDKTLRRELQRGKKFEREAQMLKLPIQEVLKKAKPAAPRRFN